MPARPAICSRYRCLWLQGGLEEEDRPDRLGAVLDLVGEAGGTLLEIREAEPGATERSPRLSAIAERFRAAVPVRITDVAEVMDPDRPARLLLADGVEQRIAGDRVTTLRPGRAPETRRLGLVERLLRRLRVGFERRRLARMRPGARGSAG